MNYREFKQLPYRKQIQVILEQPSLLNELDYKQLNTKLIKKLQMGVIKLNAFNIMNVDNPNEELQLEAVKNSPQTIEYIENPTKKVQLEIIKTIGTHMIELIKNPTEKVQLKSIENNSSTIRNIQNPTEKVQMIILKRDMNLFNWINNPTIKAKTLYALSKKL